MNCEWKNDKVKHTCNLFLTAQNALCDEDAITVFMQTLIGEQNYQNLKCGLWRLCVFLLFRFGTCKSSICDRRYKRGVDHVLTALRIQHHPTFPTARDVRQYSRIRQKSIHQHQMDVVHKRTGYTGKEGFKSLRFVWYSYKGEQFVLYEITKWL